MAAVSARPFFVKRVLDADRRFGDDRALDDALGLELLQSLAEHPIGDVGNGVPQRRESAALPEQHEQDRPGPPAADQLARAMESGAELRNVRLRRLHVRTQNSALEIQSQVATLRTINYSMYS